MNHLFKTFTSLLLGASALAALSTGCVREKMDVNPTYDNKDNTVNVQLVLNVSTDSGNGTKMTAADAQVTAGSFRGMEAVHLLTYSLGSSVNKPTDVSTRGLFYFNPNYVPSTASRDYDLGRLFTASDNISAENSSRTLELALPLETDVVVLYGKATKTGTSDQQGALTIEGGDPNLDQETDLTKLRFSLVPRLSDQKYYDAGAFVFSRIMNSITSVGLVNEPSHFTFNEAVAPIGTSDARYAFWWPRKPDDVSLPWTANGCPLDNADKNSQGQKYDDGDTVLGTDGTTTFTYHRGELSWKDLGIMYKYSVASDHETKIKAQSVAPTLTAAFAPTGRYFVFTNGLDLVLGSAYYQLIHIAKDTAHNYEELRSGSAASILRTCKDLYGVIARAAYDAEPNTDSEYAAHLLAIKIAERISQAFNVNDETHTLSSFKTAYNIVTALDQLPVWAQKYYRVINGVRTETDVYVASGTDFSDPTKNVFTDRFLPSNTEQGFPINIGLPMGGAIITTDTNVENAFTTADRNRLDTWSYVEDIPAYGMDMSSPNSKFPIQNYCYPPEILYYGNSPIRVTDKEKKLSDFPSSTTGWDTGQKGEATGLWNDWTRFGKVTSGTRSVAVDYHINYGNSLLEYSIAYGALEDNCLWDNKKAIMGDAEEDNMIQVIGEGATPGFALTGIVIGGMPKTVGWDFTQYPKNGNYSSMTYSDGKYSGLDFSDNRFDKMIYDPIPTTGGYSIGADIDMATKFYSVAFDNYDPSLAEGSQSDVYIALELVNKTGQDFWGELNMVRDGGTFYLVGKLDRASAVAAAAAAAAAQEQTSKFADLSRSNYRYPPFHPLTGATINAPRVFMQDYKTKTRFILLRDALKHAYVTVPDLRSSQVSLGLSVDIAWEEGLDFDVNIGTPPTNN